MLQPLIKEPENESKEQAPAYMIPQPAWLQSMRFFSVASLFLMILRESITLAALDTDGDTSDYLPSVFFSIIASGFLVWHYSNLTQSDNIYLSVIQDNQIDFMSLSENVKNMTLTDLTHLNIMILASCGVWTGDFKALFSSAAKGHRYLILSIDISFIFALFLCSRSYFDYHDKIKVQASIIYRASENKINFTDKIQTKMNRVIEFIDHAHPVLSDNSILVERFFLTTITLGVFVADMLGSASMLKAEQGMDCRVTALCFVIVGVLLTSRSVVKTPLNCQFSPLTLTRLDCDSDVDFFKYVSDLGNFILKNSSVPAVLKSLFVFAGIINARTDKVSARSILSYLNNDYKIWVQGNWNDFCVMWGILLSILQLGLALFETYRENRVIAQKVLDIVSRNVDARPTMLEEAVAPVTPLQEPISALSSVEESLSDSDNDLSDEDKINVDFTPRFFRPMEASEDFRLWQEQLLQEQVMK